MSVEFQTIRGVRLAYRWDGPADAPVVLLGNSLMASMAMWNAQLPALAGYRVLRMDSRGHGASPATPAPYTLALLADDVIGLLDALSVQRVHFVGLSLGGMVGQVLGARHGKRLLSLALCDTASHTPAPALWDQRIATARRDGLAALAGPTLQRWFTAPFHERAPDVVQTVQDMMLETSVEGYVGCASAVRDLDQTALLKDISVPTAVIVGEHDPACTPAQARALHERIAGSTFTEIAASAHLPNIEQPEAFNRALLAHLHAHPARR